MIAFLLTLSALSSGEGDVVWMKLDQARVAAARTSKPILVIVTVDPKTGQSVCGKSSGLDRVLSDPLVVKKADDFCFVRACDRRTATDVKAARCLELIFLDAELEELHRADFKDAAGMDKAMSAAAEKFGPRPVAWASAESVPAGKAAVYVFADERKDSAELLKALEDRAVSVFHERVVFIKAPLKGDEAKRWGVTQAPTLVIADKAELLEKLSGRKPAKDIRAAFQRALAKAQK